MWTGPPNRYSIIFRMISTPLGGILCAVPVLSAFAFAAPAAELIERQYTDGSDPLASCPGYKASNVIRSVAGLTADLTLAGPACNVFGTDLPHLLLAVEFQTGELCNCGI